MPDLFNDDFIKKVNAEIEKQVINRMDAIAIETHNILTVETPVDLGQARAGWNFTLNKSDASAPERPKKGQKLAPKQSKPDSPARKLGDKYFITNTVRHIIYLNEGHSQQRASGFVERAVHTAVKNLEG